MDGFVSFQPSEIAKFALIVLFAHMISRNLDRMDTFRYGVVPYVAIIVASFNLIVHKYHDGEKFVLQTLQRVAGRCEAMQSGMMSLAPE